MYMKRYLHEKSGQEMAGTKMSEFIKLGYLTKERMNSPLPPFSPTSLWGHVRTFADLRRLVRTRADLCRFARTCGDLRWLAVTCADLCGDLCGLAWTYADMGTCVDLCRLARTCADLRWLVRTWTDLRGLVRNFGDLCRLVRTLQTFADLCGFWGTCRGLVQTCTDFWGLVRTCIHLHSLWLWSHLLASRYKFVTVWPPNANYLFGY